MYLGIRIYIHKIHVYVYSFGTMALIMAIGRVPTFDGNSAVSIGTGERSRKVMLKPT